MNCGDRVKQIRKNKGMTLEKFGERVGVTKQTVSRIENGVNALTEQMLLSICREFNVNENWLRNGEGEMFKERSPSDEIGYYVEELLDYAGHGYSFYDMIIEMMKTYTELDEKSQAVIRNYFQNVANEMHKEEMQED